jgi:hypothetical protein
MSDASYLLTLACPNRPGIVARVTAELFSHGGNILEAHQFDDTETGRFFTRIVFNLHDDRQIPNLVASFKPIGDHYRMIWEIRPRNERRKVLLLVSKLDHCLVDLLYRWRIGELWMDVVGIISNHPRETYNGLTSARYPSTICRLQKKPGRSRKRRSRLSSPRLAPTWSYLPVTCKSCLTISLHSFPVAASTSITVSCPASRAPSPTIRLTRAA